MIIRLRLSTKRCASKSIAERKGQTPQTRAMVRGFWFWDRMQDDPSLNCEMGENQNRQQCCKAAHKRDDLRSADGRWTISLARSLSSDDDFDFRPEREMSSRILSGRCASRWRALWIVLSSRNTKTWVALHINHSFVMTLGKGRLSREQPNNQPSRKKTEKQQYEESKDHIIRLLPGQLICWVRRRVRWPQKWMRWLSWGEKSKRKQEKARPAKIGL